MPGFPNGFHQTAINHQKKFDIAHQLSFISEFFYSNNVQKLVDYFNDHKSFSIQLDKIKGYVNQDAKANTYVNIINRQVELTKQIDASTMGIKRTIKKILEDHSSKEHLAKLAEINVQLIDFQKELSNSVAEEQITVTDYETLNRAINKGFDRLCFEPIQEIYKQNAQSILKAGISETSLPYLQNLAKLNPEIHQLAEDEIANYHLEAAERLIQQNAQSFKLTFFDAENVSLNAANPYEINNNEEESLAPLYTVDSEGEVIELLLNGADPIKESKSFANTPLEHQFSLKYIQNQSLNKVNIDIDWVKDTIKNNSTNTLKTELKQTKKLLKAEKKQLKGELEKKEKLIKAHMRALVLRDSAIDPSTYSDIAYSEDYLQLWNEHKKEVAAMKQASLAADCTVYNFLTESLEKLPDISMKKVESVAVKFPYYQQELLIQKEILDNYHLVQGSDPAAMIHLSQPMQQDPLMEVKQQSDTEKLLAPKLKKEHPAKPIGSRFAHSSFFNGIKASDAGNKEEVTKQPVCRSRLHHSNLFIHTPKKVDSVSDQSLKKHKKALLKSSIF